MKWLQNSQIPYSGKTRSSRRHDSIFFVTFEGQYIFPKSSPANFPLGLRSRWPGLWELFVPEALPCQGGWGPHSSRLEMRPYCWDRTSCPQRRGFLNEVLVWLSREWVTGVKCATRSNVWGKKDLIFFWSYSMSKALHGFYWLTFIVN